ncbi:unnamed protein product [Phytophthora fragariaefolia]|uniref:Unnamed protein product n=1 Tax=Phytophthora fragariaefolia TaxID=1490495 RepID=A0A9W6X7F5_9STRA|nr:unnamed protein product [Phytophthora fragariaefolia]
MALAQDRQKEYSDRNGRGNLNVFNVGDLVLLDTRNLPLDMVSSVGSNKLKHRFIGPFAVLGRHGNAYTIDLSKSMKTHATFYVGRLKRYHDPQGQSAPDDPSQGQEEVIESLQNKTESQTPLGVPRKPVQARGKRVGSPAGRMTKVRAVGAPQQGLQQPGGPSVTHHTRESRTTVDSRAAGSHVARAAQIGGGKPPGEVSTLSQRPLGVQHGHGDHGSHDGGSGPQRGGPPEPPASRTGRQLDRQGQSPRQSRLRKGDLGRDASLPVAMQPLGRRSSTEIENPQPLSEARSRTRPPPALLDRNGDLHYYVERVLQGRRIQGKRQLLVKWRGYPTSQNSWEPEDRLRVDCPKAVAIWNRSDSSFVSSPWLLSYPTRYGDLGIGTIPALITSAAPTLSCPLAMRWANSMRSFRWSRTEDSASSALS